MNKQFTEYILPNQVAVEGMSPRGKKKKMHVNSLGAQPSQNMQRESKKNKKTKKTANFVLNKGRKNQGFHIKGKKLELEMIWN